MNQPPVSRRTFIKTSALALPLLAGACRQTNSNPSPAGKSAKDFVTVRNGRFELRGRPYFYIGTSLWYGCYLGDPELAGGRQRLVRELDRLRKLGITNVRILAGSETSPLVGAIPRGITRAPRDWDEDLLCGLDFCLAEMARRGMRAVPFLSNYWQWSGSFAQYVRWITGESIPDPDLPVMERGDWGGFMRFSARFYTIPEAVELYREYVTRLIHRRNTVNGRIYRDDPTIMTWELANEPRPGTDEANGSVTVFSQWVDATARWIHEQDPHHLVCTGSEGIWGSLRKPENFIQAHETPAIDYVTVHMWLKNWGWLRDPHLSPGYEKAAARARDHVEEHTVIATEKLHKPLVLEEFGLPRDHDRREPDSPTTARDDYFQRMFNQVVESCRAGRALQGANFWTWTGEGRAGSGKPESTTALTGDPFCEPQGLNSVFDTDISTQAVVAEANKTLAAFAK
jgi:mannan endo-1,4-beta-mannosidase